MTPEQKAAYVIAQSVCAFAELMHMTEHNTRDSIKGIHPPLYNPSDFIEVMDKYGLQHNTLISFFRD